MNLRHESVGIHFINQPNRHKASDICAKLQMRGGPVKYLAHSTTDDS